MNIQHISFDIPKKFVPISVTTIRKNLFENWNFLPDSVKPYFAIKVVILGTESTGKTIMTQKIAAYFNCNFVFETGREIIANSNFFNFDDLYI
ncbi:MAG: hypothetical protein EAZ06_09620 [Cytophagales bacterium]|nr:MAG: hypothetical protein EAZ06_09620 [Cytophagales bacterium]